MNSREDEPSGDGPEDVDLRRRLIAERLARMADPPRPEACPKCGRPYERERAYGRESRCLNCDRPKRRRA